MILHKAMNPEAEHLHCDPAQVRHIVSDTDDSGILRNGCSKVFTPAMHWLGQHVRSRQSVHRLRRVLICDN
jgi:hypothetical protein